jgi:hypothetical protein
LVLSIYNRGIRNMKLDMKKFLPQAVLVVAIFSLSGFLMFGTQVPTSEGQFCSQLLGHYSDDYLRFTSGERTMRLRLNENRRKGSETIFINYASELADTIDVDITASGLPPDIRLEEEVIESSGGAGTIKYFFLTGTPTRAGEYEVELHASSPGCEDDEGRVFITVASDVDHIRCELTSSGGVGPGESATLSWRIFNVAARNASMFPSIAGDPTSLRRAGSGQTNPLTEDTEFTLTVDGPDNSYQCSTKVLVGGISGSTTQFLKTLLDMPTIYRNGSQYIYDAIYWNDRFVFSGSCGVDMSGTSIGGGLWSIKSDGSGNIQEREACLDAGSGSNSIYHHGQVNGAYLHPDGDRGFVRGNQSWASCLAGGTDHYQQGQDCSQYGPGANRAVYYTAGSEGRVDVLDLSPDDDPNNPLADIRSRWQIPEGVAGGYVFGNPSRNDGWIARLPTWHGVTSISKAILPKVSFGDYVIAQDPDERTFKVYAVEEGRVREVQTLPGDIKFLLYYAIDYSTTPERLVIYSPNTRGDSSRRILTYIQTESGLELVSEQEAPASSSDRTYSTPISAKGGFGVLGEYLIWPIRDGFSVLRNGQVVDSVRFPKGGRAINIVVSPTGHIAVNVSFSEEGRRTAAYLYKLGGATGQPPVLPPGIPTFPTYPTPPTYTGDISVFLDAANQYMNQLKSIFGGSIFGASTMTTSAIRDILEDTRDKALEIQSILWNR